MNFPTFLSFFVFTICLVNNCYILLPFFLLKSMPLFISVNLEYAFLIDLIITHLNSLYNYKSYHLCNTFLFIFLKVPTLFFSFLFKRCISILCYLLFPLFFFIKVGVVVYTVYCFPSFFCLLLSFCCFFIIVDAVVYIVYYFSTICTCYRLFAILCCFVFLSQIGVYYIYENFRT